MENKNNEPAIITVAEFADKYLFNEIEKVTLQFRNKNVFCWNQYELYQFKDDVIEEIYSNSMGLHLVIDREVQKYEIA